MAIAKCGQHWSWDSPMWCSGKTVVDTAKESIIDKMCVSCPWWKGNNKINENE